MAFFINQVGGSPILVVLDSNSTQSDDENTFSTASINENDINMQFKGTKEGLSLYYTNADNLIIV